MTITKSRADMAQDLRDLADIMLDRATDLDYFGGIDATLVKHSQQLIGASALVMTWVAGLEAKQ